MKKGVIFTFMAMLALGLLFVLLTPTPTDQGPTFVTKNRIQEADNYVRTLDEVMIPRALYVNSIRTTSALAIYVGNATFFTDEAQFQRAFKEVLLNATLNGVSINSQTVINAYGKGLYVYLDEIANASRDYLFINTTFDKRYDLASVKVYQNNETGAWRAGVNFSINYTASIDGGLWNRTSIITITYGFIGLDDPLYTGSTDGISTNKIKDTNITTWGIGNFTIFMNSKEYVFDERAPSYLQRFWNSTTPSDQSCCGIESIVSADVDAKKPGPRTRSFVDCHYFGGVCASFAIHNLTGVTNATYLFAIDDDRAYTKYNVGGLTY